MMYYEYSNGSFTVQQEQEMLVLGYKPDLHLQDQVLFRSFEFYSILEDHDEQ